MHYFLAYVRLCVGLNSRGRPRCSEGLRVPVYGRCPQMIWEEHADFILPRRCKEHRFPLVLRRTVNYQSFYLFYFVGKKKLISFP